MLGTSARPILTSGPALFTPKLPKVAPRSAESGRGRGLESTRRRCTERWELVWLAGACAVGMRRSGLDRTLAIAECRAQWPVIAMSGSFYGDQVIAKDSYKKGTRPQIRITFSYEFLCFSAYS